MITGKAKANFEHRQAGASIVSTVEVYATRRQAVGDFRTGAKPGVARCLGRLLAKGFRQGGLEARVVSARMLRRPTVGELMGVATRVLDQLALGRTVAARPR